MDLSSWLGSEPLSPALEGGFLTTGPPRKSLNQFLSLSTMIVPVSQGYCEGRERKRKGTHPAEKMFMGFKIMGHLYYTPPHNSPQIHIVRYILGENSTGN